MLCLLETWRPEAGPEAAPGPIMRIEATDSASGARFTQLLPADTGLAILPGAWAAIAGAGTLEVAIHVLGRDRLESRRRRQRHPGFRVG